ncbi:MAG: hypothetical protein EYX74_04600 [Desulfobulbaceae bacterium]|nr:MAG: hypothetical protein EYX74_04600 [Desulfobulbaceae bacterium]
MVEVSFLGGRSAALLTKHQKEKVIKPTLEKGTGCRLIVTTAYDTDLFGAFTREVARRGSQLAVARRKAQKAMELAGTELGVASEGSFGPHPAIPFLPFNREIVLLIDAKAKLEIRGECANSDTNFASAVVKNFTQAAEFANQARFPDHFLVLRPDSETHPELVKGINDWAWLKEALSWALAKSVNGQVFLETDMRALANPTRMQNIKKATIDLVAKLNSGCPGCKTPGFAIVAREPGLPCELCGFPTKEVAKLIFACQKCGYQVEKLGANKTAAAARCDYCNP